MAKEVFVIPRQNLIVRDAETYEILPQEGGIKVLNKFWRRRIKCGDVSIQNKIEDVPNKIEVDTKEIIEKVISKKNKGDKK